MLSGGNTWPGISQRVDTGSASQSCHDKARSMAGHCTLVRQQTVHPKDFVEPAMPISARRAHGACQG